MLHFVESMLWSIIGDAGLFVSSVGPSSPAPLSFHISTGNMGSRPVPGELPCGIGALLDRGKEARPEACLAPAIKTAGDGAPGAISLRQVTPGGAGTQEPEAPVEDASVIGSRAAGFGLLRRQ